MVFVTPYPEGCGLREQQNLTIPRQLYDLQELDLELDRASAQIVALNKRIQDDAAVASARLALAQRHESIQQMRRQQAKRTQDVRDLQAKSKELEGRLYGGAVRSVKEMEALQTEVRGLQNQARKIEDEELLALMVKLEEDEAWEKKASAELAKLEQERASLVGQWTSERGKLEAAMPSLKSRRQEMASACAPAVLSQYEALRRTKQGQAVSRMERGMCSGCRMTLPARESQRVRISKDPVLCPSCGRMLYAG